MKIQGTQSGYFSGKILDWNLYVRKDLTVVKASEWFYMFVGDSSYLPVSSLISEEDGKLLQEAARNLTEPIELITTIANDVEEYRNIYLRMENSEETEDGNPLLHIKFWGIRDMVDRCMYMEHQLGKYRHFMTLVNAYYFEYTLDNNKIVFYKYINERAMSLMSGTLEEFVEKMDRENQPTLEQQEQMSIFCNYLRSSTASFEMEFTMYNHEGASVCAVKGGCLYKDKNVVAGIMTPEQLSGSEAYYLTPAARDAGTGLFNKKAITEFAIEKLQLKDQNTRWFIIMDIDDFKDINDTYGHLFGDQVIRKVADILQVNAGYRGVVGRFGGDEYFVMLEKVPDRAALKTWIKTVVKEMTYAFDPKLKVTASIGVSQYPADGDDYEELFAKADKALYIAKEKGKNRHIIYEEKLHGVMVKDDMKNMVTAYTVSKVKRREALIELISNIYGHGVGYITDNPKVQKNLRDLFDLDGITIFTDYGKRVVCRSGNYVHEAPDIQLAFNDSKYMDLFGDEDILVQSNMLKLKSQNIEAYKVATYQEIGASIQCLSKKDGVPYAMIHFEVFNRNRKWSDTDIEMLGIVGSCIGNLLCETAE